MSLETILAAIRAAGDAQVSEIEAGARTQIYEIMATARLEAEDLEEDACNNAVAPASKERARIIHRARLESMRIVGGAREELIEKTLERTRGVLAGLRTDRAYPDVLCRLLEEAMAELQSSVGEGVQVKIEADPKDFDLLERMLRHMVLELRVSYTLDGWGGLVARSEDGRVMVSNILETRLERALPFLRQYLAALFEDEQWQTSTTATHAFTP